MIRYLLLLLTIPVFGQVDSVLMLEDAISIALENNYDIQLERNNLQVAANNNTIGNAGLLPTVSAQAGINQSIQDSDLEFADGGTQVRTGAKTNSRNASASLAWTLFDGRSLFALSALEATNRLSDLSLKAQVQQTMADVMKAFYNLAFERERLLLLESTLILSEERLQISKQKYEVGKASKLEYLQAQVDYNTDNSALLVQNEVIATQRIALSQLLSVDPGSQFDIVYDWNLDENILLDELEARALTDNPVLLQRKSELALSEINIRQLKYQQLPSLDFNLGYSYSQLNAEAGFIASNQSNGVNYGLTARITVFDGMNQRRGIQNSQIQMESINTAIAQTENQLLSGLRTAFITYQNSLTRIDLEEKNLAVADENVTIALERYRVGKSNPLEVREAQNNAVNANTRYLNAKNMAKLAEIELYRLSGVLIGE